MTISFPPVTTPQLSDISGANHHCRASGRDEASSSASASSLMSAIPTQASTAIATASSLLYAIPGLSDASSTPTNIIV